jgi:hypothetical protein
MQCPLTGVKYIQFPLTQQNCRWYRQQEVTLDPTKSLVANRTIVVAVLVAVVTITQSKLLAQGGTGIDLGA